MLTIKRASLGVRLLSDRINKTIRVLCGPAWCPPAQSIAKIHLQSICGPAPQAGAHTGRAAEGRRGLEGEEPGVPVWLLVLLVRLLPMACIAGASDW